MAGMAGEGMLCKHFSLFYAHLFDTRNVVYVRQQKRPIGVKTLILCPAGASTPVLTKDRHIDDNDNLRIVYLRIQCGQHRCARIQSAHEARLRNAERLLLHGLVNGCLCKQQIQFIKHSLKRGFLKGQIEAKPIL